jgi:tetratricopeptide (TPR) repeat protein
MLVTIRPRGSALGLVAPGEARQGPAAGREGEGESCEEANRRVAVALKSKGNVLYLKGDYAQAASTFSAALRMTLHGSPLHAALLANRSAAYLKWGQPELAAADAQAALTAAPSDVKPYWRLVQALTTMGMHSAALYTVDWASRACAEMTARQRAQLSEVRATALARVAQGAQEDRPLSTRLSVRSRSPGSTGSHINVYELLTVGDGGVLLQTLSMLLHIPRARLKVICTGVLLRQDTATKVVRAAAGRADGRTLVLQVMGDPEDDESGLDARDLEVLRKQLGLARKDAVARMRAARGDVFNALLL